MIIDISTLLTKITIPIKGVIHIGAHECEERDFYINHLNINDNNIIWIDALEEKVNKMKASNNKLLIFNECISNEDNKDVSFMVTNNYQSSSILNLKTHIQEHPWVHEIYRISMKTKTLKTFYKNNQLNINDYNFINIDIQGAELMALKGADDILNNIDYLYLEVNEKELYDGCALLPELEEYLLKYGFKRSLINMTSHGWGDAFYTK